MEDNNALSLSLHDSIDLKFVVATEMVKTELRKCMICRVLQREVPYMWLQRCMEATYFGDRHFCRSLICSVICPYTSGEQSVNKQHPPPSFCSSCAVLRLGLSNLLIESHLQPCSIFAHSQASVQFNLWPWQHRLRMQIIKESLLTASTTTTVCCLLLQPCCLCSLSLNFLLYPGILCLYLWLSVSQLCPQAIQLWLILGTHTLQVGICHVPQSSSLFLQFLCTFFAKLGRILTELVLHCFQLHKYGVGT